MVRILHFADAHIDIANHGRHDPQTGLAVRVTDFLKSLDTIVDTAIAEQVDLVLFAGDAYKDRTPPPTFQREWGRRIMRLSRAGIRTLLLVGNHDLSPALNRAHALEAFDTLEVPHVRVLGKPQFLGPDDLEGLPLQVLALPWIARSGLMATLEMDAGAGNVYEELEKRLVELVDSWLQKADPSLPTVLTAHASVQGAVYGGERTVMLGGDLVLAGSLVRDPRLDYVALGHIHKSQDLNPGRHPPVIYPGSIERVDWGEAQDDKFFILAHVARGRTQVEWRKLAGVRPFVNRMLRLEERDGITEQLYRALPPPAELQGAVVRLVLEYPRDWEALIDEAALRAYTAECLEFRLVKHPQVETRIRLPADQAIASLSALELLDKYWQSAHTPKKDTDVLSKLAAQVIRSVEESTEV